MFICYKYQGKSYRMLVNWTSAEGKSTVFRDATQKAAERHGFDIGGHIELAEHLDALTDNLYGLITVFLDDYFSIPYEPRFRKQLIKSLSEISTTVKAHATMSRYEHELLLAHLFADVANKLRKIVGVYLEEHAYRCKYRERMRDSEQYMETTSPDQLSFEFEDMLIQMTEISRQMECLSEMERRFLVKHIFLKYTFREIAEQEGIGKTKAHSIISAALKRIKERLE